MYGSHAWAPVDTAHSIPVYLAACRWTPPRRSRSRSPRPGRLLRDHPRLRALPEVVVGDRARRASSSATTPASAASSSSTLDMKIKHRPLRARVRLPQADRAHLAVGRRRRRVDRGASTGSASCRRPAPRPPAGRRSELGFWMPGPLRRLAERTALKQSVDEFKAEVERRSPQRQGGRERPAKPDGRKKPERGRGERRANRRLSVASWPPALAFALAAGRFAAGLRFAAPACAWPAAAFFLGLPAWRPPWRRPAWRPLSSPVAAGAAADTPSAAAARAGTRRSNWYLILLASWPYSMFSRSRSKRCSASSSRRW